MTEKLSAGKLPVAENSSATEKLLSAKNPPPTVNFLSTKNLPPAKTPSAARRVLAVALACAIGGALLSCAGRAGAGPEAPETAAARRIASPRGALFPGAVRPGEPFAVVIALPEDRGDLFAVLTSPRGRSIARAAFFTLETDEGGAALKAALMAVPSLAATGEARVSVEGLPAGEFPPEGAGPGPAAGESVAADFAAISGAAVSGAALAAGGLPLIILDREFQSETIALDRRNTSLRTEPSPQKTAEAEHLWAILNRTGNEIYAEAAFVPPVSSTRRTSLYGGRRVYRYVTGTSDTSVHAGIDYGVPTGTEVAACAPGRVVLARERTVTGNSVIIEHLPGVYSLYYHLDSIALEEGVFVEAGETVGLSGATGLATGPHLHWEIRAAGENADPDAFTARPLLDRSVIHQVLSW